MTTWGKFPAADPQILGAKVRNLFTRDLYTPGLRLGDVEMVVCCSVLVPSLSEIDEAWRTVVNPADGASARDSHVFHFLGLYVDV